MSFSARLLFKPIRREKQEREREKEERSRCLEAAYVSVRTVLKHNEEGYETSSISFSSSTFDGAQTAQIPKKKQQTSPTETVYSLSHRNSNNKHKVDLLKMKAYLF